MRTKQVIAILEKDWLAVCLRRWWQQPGHTPKIQLSPSQKKICARRAFNFSLQSLRWRACAIAEPSCERYKPQLPASLLEIAESGRLRGVGCRQGPVAEVSASHATAAVTPQSSHSCRTGPLCSHHLCGSEGSQAGDREGGKGPGARLKVVSHLQIWKSTEMTDKEDG